MAALGLILAACTGPATATPPPASQPSPTSRPTAGATSTPAPSGASSAAPTERREGFAPGGAVLERPSVSSAIAITPDGTLVVGVNPDSDSVTLVDARSLRVVAEVAVGEDPRTLAVTPDGAYAIVANRGDDTVSAVDLAARREAARWPVGAMPYGVVTDGVRAYVAEFGSGSVAVIDQATGEVERRLVVDGFPAGLGLTEHGRLLVTHFFTGAVTTIDAASLTVGATAYPAFDANLAQSIALAPGGGHAFIPHTRPNTTNPAPLFDTTVFPVVSIFEVDPGEFRASARITLDTADRPVSMPFAAVLAPDGSTLYVANAGSDDVSVIDLDTGIATANVKVGANPRGIALTPDGSRLFVNNVLDGTVTVIDTATSAATTAVHITDIQLPETILLGKRLFNAAIGPRLTTDNWISCAVCHPDGLMDKRTWLGFPDGPRNTPSLLGVAETGPFHWSGDFDELQDVEITIRRIQGGAGLVEGQAYDSLGPRHAGRSRELDALAAYLQTLRLRPSPLSQEALAVDRGRKLFTEFDCSECHTAPAYTDGLLHEVGTGDPNKERNSHGRGTRFDTPALRSLWLTAPYFHDGSAGSLRDVLSAGTAHNIAGGLSKQEIDDLVRYLLSLP